MELRAVLGGSLADRRARGPRGRVRPSKGTGLTLQLPIGPSTRMGVALGSLASGRVGLCPGGNNPEGHPTQETPAPCAQMCVWGYVCSRGAGLGSDLFPGAEGFGGPCVTPCLGPELGPGGWARQQGVQAARGPGKAWLSPMLPGQGWAPHLSAGCGHRGQALRNRGLLQVQLPRWLVLGPGQSRQIRLKLQRGGGAPRSWLRVDLARTERQAPLPPTSCPPGPGAALKGQGQGGPKSAKFPSRCMFARMF